eukprot:TRINITY_DN24877_c0_g1_i1.p1 TRINITY_DN24877_c0_g1~~TRINITY_DN24877_c0_g1_i1.p1  ORF type:complete len:1063 (+),score=301.91 TRINITY_DN24877_c0_g1_i1:64-3252(+)
MAYSGQQVDNLATQFEKCAARQIANKDSVVKLRASERDLLQVAEQARDLFERAVKGDKDKLAEVFKDAGLMRFHRFRNAMESVELSDMHKNDQRWGHLKDVMDAIQEILEQLGMFKPFVRAVKPDAIVYKAAPQRFSPGEEVNLQPEITGGAPVRWEVTPALPEGLTLSYTSGEITGQLRADEQVPFKKYTITAGNDAGTVSFDLPFSVMPPAPESLSYPDVRDCTTAEAVTFEPQLKGGNASEWSVFPALPKGMQIDGETGVIQGSPHETLPKQDYTVTAKNASGQVQAVLNFAVVLAPPVALSYPGVKAHYPEGQVLHLVPDVQMQGRKASKWKLASKMLLRQKVPDLPQQVKMLLNKLNYAIEPELPEGLAIIKKTGIITGKPAKATPSATYTVTASNEGGKVSAPVTFEIKVLPPSDLAYGGLDKVFYIGQPVALTPKVAGVVNEWSVDPALPAGLELEPNMGTISGIPTAETKEGDKWTVTAKNAEGDVTAVLDFAVKREAPQGLAYPDCQKEYPVNRPVEDLAPTYKGEVDEFSVSPELPAGLSLDKGNGLISGTPTEVVEEKTYEVQAKNTTGSTSANVTFAIKTLPPSELKYPGVDDKYTVGEAVDLKPEVEGGVTTWAVEPALPEGMSFDPATGIISGAPTKATDEGSYVVTASNGSGGTSVVLTFTVEGAPEPEPVPEQPKAEEPTEVSEEEEHEAFAAMLEGITDLADLPPAPPKGKRMNWMLWMVHRAHLNDPELVDFVFTNLKMPLPHVEPRIAPKLAKAMAHNTYIEKLEMANSNLQRPQGVELAESLRTNRTLKILNVESNALDSESLMQIADALKMNTDSGLEQWRFNNQKAMGSSFGRPLEEAVAGLLEKNSRIVKLGFPCQDPHWRNKIDKAILRNNDTARRRRKSLAAKMNGPIVLEKPMKKIALGAPPQKPVWEIFADDDAKLRVCRLYVATYKALPTRQNLQPFAKGKGVSVPFSGVGPLVKEFSAKLMSSAAGTQVTVSDDRNAEVKATLHSCTEKNDRWIFETCLDDGMKINFVCNATPEAAISEEYAEWLRPAEEGSA